MKMPKKSRKSRLPDFQVFFFNLRFFMFSDCYVKHFIVQIFLFFIILLVTINKQSCQKSQKIYILLFMDYIDKKC